MIVKVTKRWHGPARSSRMTELLLLPASAGLAGVALEVSGRVDRPRWNTLRLSAAGPRAEEVRWVARHFPSPLIGRRHRDLRAPRSPEPKHSCLVLWGRGTPQASVL